MDFSFIITSGLLNGLIWALMCLGVYLSYRILDCADLSVEGTFPLGACVAGMLIYFNVPPLIATFIACLAGLLAGGLTGVLHTKLKIPAILSGIITMTGLYTINMVILGFTKPNTSTTNNIPINQSIFTPIREILRGLNDSSVIWIRIILIVICLLIIGLVILKILSFKKHHQNWFDKEVKTKTVLLLVFGAIIAICVLGLLIVLLIPAFSNELLDTLVKGLSKKANDFSILVVAGLFVALVFGLCYWFFGTEIGMSLRATGNNQRMAKAQGINTTIMIIFGLAISNALVALSGAIFAQELGNANIEMGKGVIVIGLASVVIGEVIFGRKDFKKALISVVVGSIIYYLLNAMAIELNVVNYLKLVSAVLIVVILAIPLIKKRFKKHKIKDGGVSNA